jgi:hypothetical protein
LGGTNSKRKLLSLKCDFLPLIQKNARVQENPLPVGDSTDLLLLLANLLAIGANPFATVYQNSGVRRNMRFIMHFQSAGWNKELWPQPRCSAALRKVTPNIREPVVVTV